MIYFDESEYDKYPDIELTDDFKNTFYPKYTIDSNNNIHLYNYITSMKEQINNDEMDIDDDNLYRNKRKRDDNMDYQNANIESKYKKRKDK